MPNGNHIALESATEKKKDTIKNIVELLQNSALVSKTNEQFFQSTFSSIFDFLASGIYF